MPKTRFTSANSPFIAAARSEPHDRIPVWFMRQAGRSLPEYHNVRGEGSILNAISQPDVATEITLQPVRRYDTDAAILYSDIMTPMYGIDFGVDIEPGVGPVTERPFRTRDDLNRLRPLTSEKDTPYVNETVTNLVSELEVPLIGFAGAPFTVASYLIEGRPSKTYAQTKRLMFSDPQLFADLLDRLADIAAQFLVSQVERGASAIQLFDSWAGALSPKHYEQYVLPASTKVLDALRSYGVPMTHFGVNTSELLGHFAEAGASVIGVDWRTPLATARTRVPTHCALQGNLDPAIVLAGWDATRDAATDVLADNGGHLGHIFNLGHGVLPETDPTVLEKLVKWVHEQPVRGKTPLDSSGTTT